MTSQTSLDSNVVALIPARSGSLRVKDKNVRPLAGHPLIGYTISAALNSGVFQSVIVSTDSQAYAEKALEYGAEVPFLRPAEMAGPKSMDIDWVYDTLTRLDRAGRKFDCFSILRPTSPFRLPETIQRAWNEFLSDPQTDSLRAVEKCKQHPGKMWIRKGKRIEPFIQSPDPEKPYHSMPYHSLPEVYVQNASLEIAYTRVALQDRTIAGTKIVPFFTDDNEGFDINNESDWFLAEHMAEQGVKLPKISVNVTPQ
ncbi:acylneuraminate cytidylyltransferase family protein [Omnitrophica bacterium]|nr:acylneuraminate cytidylyltransferase family protein [Candidatus Omnitrophota bacterium]